MSPQSGPPGFYRHSCPLRPPAAERAREMTSYPFRQTSAPASVGAFCWAPPSAGIGVPSETLIAPVSERTGQTIDLKNNYAIDLAGANVPQECLQGSRARSFVFTL
jgi:hypothetical protein